MERPRRLLEQARGVDNLRKQADMAQTSRPCKGCGTPVMRTKPTGAIPSYCGPDCRPRCSVPGCDNPHRENGMCKKHDHHVRRHGDPLAPSVFIRGEGGYDAVHHKLRTHRGPARGFPCVDCGERAAEWSYDHADPNEVINSNVRPSQFANSPFAFSRDISHYEPRCIRCHRVFDKLP